MFFNSKGIFVFILYLSTLALFFNCQSFFMYWLFLELNLLVYLVVINWAARVGIIKYTADIGMYYFFIQSIGSFIFIVVIVCDFSSTPTYTFDILLSISLIIKIGLFPLHGWVFKISEKIPRFPLLILITLQKLPLFIYFFSMSLDLICLICLASLSAGALYAMYSRSIEHLIVSSTIYTTIWFYILYKSNFYSFLLIFVSYLIFSWLLIVYTIVYKYPNKSKFRVVGLRFVIGMPPYRVFFLKFYTLTDMAQSLSPFLVVLCWLISFIIIVSYLKFFWTLCFCGKDCVKSVEAKVLYPIYYLLFVSLVLLFL